MQILIDVPDRIYKIVQNKTLNIIDSGIVEKAIKDGTPLPKGHGRLKDVDWIDDNCEYHYSDKDGSWCYTCRDIENAPTIIEADKVESEVEEW